MNIMVNYDELDLPEIGGLLGMMIHGPSERPYYMVGRRALNGSSGDEAYGGTQGSVSHEHFILNDGVGNIGFAGHGEFVEPPSVLEEYAVTPKYGTKKYYADVFDQARANWHSKNDEIDRVVSELGVEEFVPPHFYSEYHALLNNCQDYVGWLDAEYDRLMGTRSGLK